MNKEICKEYGIDWENGVARFNGNKEIYVTLLTMFLEDTTFPRMAAAYYDGNHKELFESAHELKGVAGNTALVELLEKTSLLVEYLRTGNDDEEVVSALFTATEAVYHKTIKGIRLSILNENGANL